MHLKQEGKRVEIGALISTPYYLKFGEVFHWGHDLDEVYRFRLGRIKRRPGALYIRYLPGVLRIGNWFLMLDGEVFIYGHSIWKWLFHPIKTYKIHRLELKLAPIDTTFEEKERIRLENIRLKELILQNKFDVRYWPEIEKVVVIGDNEDTSSEISSNIVRDSLQKSREKKREISKAKRKDAPPEARGTK